MEKTTTSSIASLLDGHSWEAVAPYVVKFTPAVGQYLLSDGSWVKRVEGKVLFIDHGIKEMQRARGFTS